MQCEDGISFITHQNLIFSRKKLLCFSKTKHTVLLKHFAHFSSLIYLYNDVISWFGKFWVPPTQYKSKSDPPSIYHIITSFEILGKIFYNVRCVKNNSLILMLIYSLSFHFHLQLLNTQSFPRSKSNKMIINVYAKHELAHSFSRVEFQK